VRIRKKKNSLIARTPEKAKTRTFDVLDACSGKGEAACKSCSLHDSQVVGFGSSGDFGGFFSQSYLVESRLDTNLKEYYVKKKKEWTF